MKIKFVGTCPKDLSSPEFNEDQMAFNLSNCALALSDGASESFNSKAWAKILSKKFVSDQNVDSDWLSKSVVDYEKKHDKALISWAKQNAFERGSFATLLGIEYCNETMSIKVFAIGDSIAILVSNYDIIYSWPFTNANEFNNRPTLLSTKVEHNLFINDKDFKINHLKHFEIKNIYQPILLCLTDAIGEWALKDVQDRKDRIYKLCNLTSIEELSNLVIEERLEKRMRIDDSTIVVLSFEME